jgi:hypothetical protein
MTRAFAVADAGQCVGGRLAVADSPPLRRGQRERKQFMFIGIGTIVVIVIIVLIVLALRR